MYDNFKWTSISEGRNGVLQQYEPLQPFLLYELAKHVGATVFIDIGANIGAYTLFLSKLPRMTTIRSFEAAPATFRELETNLRLNDALRVVLPVQKAVSSSFGTVSFGIVSDYSGANGVSATSLRSGYPHTLTVEADTLDSLVDFRDQVCAVKIDVEGHEPHVLAGGRQFFTSNQVILQIEDYDATADKSATRALNEMSYRRLVKVGPDAYFSNILGIGPEVILRALEDASSELIRFNLRPKAGSDSAQPAIVHLPGGIEIRIAGGLARAGRRLKTYLKRKRAEG